MKNGKQTLFLIFLLFLSSQLSAKTLRVGVALRFSDRFNSTVDSLAKGIETAKLVFEKRNPGVRIVLNRFSHERDLVSTMTAAEDVIRAKVPAVIGGETSDEAMVLGDTLGPEKIVLFTPTSSNPRVTEGKPFVFRGCFTDTHVADAMAKYVATVLKPKKIGIIHNISLPYSDYLTKRFLESLGSNGPEIFVEKVLRRHMDFSKQIDAFIHDGVTHVIFFSYDQEFTRFLLHAERKKFFPFYIGSDGWGSNEYVFQKSVKESSSGEKFIAVRNSYWREENKSRLTSAFRSAFRAKFGTTPNAWSAIAFDTAWVLFSVMNGVKDPNDGEQIQQALKKMDPMKLLTTDSFLFDENNSPKKDLHLYRIDKKGIRFEGTLR